MLYILIPTSNYSEYLSCPYFAPWSVILGLSILDSRPHRLLSHPLHSDKSYIISAYHLPVLVLMACGELCLSVLTFDKISRNYKLLRQGLLNLKFEIIRRMFVE